MASERLNRGCYLSWLLVSLLLMARMASDFGHLGFAVRRWELVLFGLGVGMLCAFLVSPEPAEAMIFVLRTCVLLFVVCGLVAFFTAALVFGARCPAWLAVPIALVLSFFAFALLAIGVGGDPFELVEPFCMILLLANLLWPVFEQAKHKAEFNRKHRQVPARTLATADSPFAVPRVTALCDESIRPTHGCDTARRGVRG
jgi:hypothetical protein